MCEWKGGERRSQDEHGNPPSLPPHPSQEQLPWDTVWAGLNSWELVVPGPGVWDTKLGDGELQDCAMQGNVL